MKKKYYAVKKGNVPGIYESWSDCQKQVNGYSGAVYRSFDNKRDAESFIEVLDKKANEIHEDYIDVYIDGSFDAERNYYSCGIVILLNEEIITLSKKNNKKDYVDMRNVAGELLGALMTMQWAVENKVKKINLHYDYEGIEKWATGDWTAKKIGTKEYKKKFDDYKKSVIVKFTKVKAHSGVEYNELADQLAKQALLDTVTTADYDCINEVDYNVFDKCAEDKKKNVSVYFTVEGYRFTQNQLVKYIKEIWKKEGNKVKDIELIEVSVDCEKSLILWKVNNQNYIQKLKESI